MFEAVYELADGLGIALGTSTFGVDDPDLAAVAPWPEGLYARVRVSLYAGGWSPVQCLVHGTGIIKIVKGGSASLSGRFASLSLPFFHLEDWRFDD